MYVYTVSSGIYHFKFLYVYVYTLNSGVYHFKFLSASAIIPTGNILRYFEGTFWGFLFFSIFGKCSEGRRNTRLFCAPRGANSRVRSRWLICCMNIASATCLQWQGDSAMARFIRTGKEEATDAKLTGGCGGRKEGGRSADGDGAGGRQAPRVGNWWGDRALGIVVSWEEDRTAENGGEGQVGFGRGGRG